jgi:hypothetical protein
MELQFVKPTKTKKNVLWITAILRHLGRNPDRQWRMQCDHIYRDLRGYLIGSSMAAH